MKNKIRFILVFVLLLAGAPKFVSADEVRVREYFSDIPEMIDIARCESNFRQYTDAGNVLQGGVGGKMIGVFQLHSDYHVAPSLAMGLDINTFDGNVAYARHLYEREGLSPWTPCLGAVTVTSMPSAAPAESQGLSNSQRAELIKRIEGLQMQVYVLQIKLLKMQLAELGVSFN